MLDFHSATARAVTPKAAIGEIGEKLGPSVVSTASLIMIHGCMGHCFEELAQAASRMAPQAAVVGASCCGVIGTDTVSEHLRDVAVMAVCGPETAAVHLDNVRAANSRQAARDLARRLREQLPGVTMVYLMASGIDIANDELIRGIEDELGPDVEIFGATSADNMRGAVSYQIFGPAVYRHSAWLVGFADPTLEVRTAASHGFVAFGRPMVVTRASENRIIELDGRPAWDEYVARLGLDPGVDCGATIPIGALAEKLDEERAAEYGNPHVLRVVTSRDPDGTMHYATTIRKGTELWLTIRDEDRIFRDLDRMTGRMAGSVDEARAVAVFHADCLARGRHTFDRIEKGELIAKMQAPFRSDGRTPPWLGIYGFGEFARLGGRNEFHNYTSAVYALYRRPHRANGPVFPS